MIDLLKGKPTSVMSVKTEATYDEIMHAIHHNQIPDKTLRAVVNMCRSHPAKCLFVIYRAFSDKVLFIFGSKPICMEMEGSKLQTIMNRHCLESRIYVFSYVK